MDTLQVLLVAAAVLVTVLVVLKFRRARRNGDGGTGVNGALNDRRPNHK